MEWISVKDRLPKGEALCLNDRNDVIIGYLEFTAEDHFVAENEHEILTDVTHWMEIPKPPLRG
jgi:hypothetical protein